MKRISQARRDAKQLFRLCLVDGLLDADRVRQVVLRVSETNNRNRLIVLCEFRRLVKFDSTKHSATVESATPLQAEMKASIQAELSRVYGVGLNTTFIHNPDLIGGMRIKVGSDVYDGSIKARLATLESRF
ncbi:MAG: F0F1 ATP synthase subunit delta [Planctomycetes bacterium]|nr:F0F1 ATP synthase subunit delta [Planctomycetota bacterium]